MATAVRECKGCGREFAQQRRQGRPREYCDDCKPGGAPAQPLELAHGETWVQEVSRLTNEAEALDAEAEQLAVAAKAKRAEAAKTRARADRIAGALQGVTARRQPTALERVRDDGLLAAAGLASEDLPDGFTPRDLAATLGIADVARAGRLLLALVELDKVIRHGDGYMTVDEDEVAVRDYIVGNREFSFGDAIAALGLPETALGFYLTRLGERGLVEGAGGFYRYVDAPNDAPNSRPRRRPPELDPPAGIDAPVRGMPVFIEDHGQNAKAGGKHRANLKKLARQRQETAREERAAEQRRRAK